MHQKKAALFYDYPLEDGAVFGSGRRERLAELSDLHPHVINAGNFDVHAPELADLEVIFASWGMPNLTDEQLGRLPKLAAVFYAAGNVKAFAQQLVDHDIVLVSAWAINAIPVAEMCLAQILLSLRGYFRSVRRYRELRDTTASIYYVPDFFTFDLIQSRTSEIMGVPVVSMRETPFYGYRGVMKRVSDVGFTLILLIPTLPVMLALALLIRLNSKGPVIFRQRRYGLDGQEIVVYKFRSMYVTEDGQTIDQASKNDPRITPVGRFIRKFSLDELPQLFNVLQGRMSLVGPRPHAVAHNEQYRRLIKGYMIRHKVLPGITGLAQVNGCRGETRDLVQMEQRVAYDLDYLRHWSPLLDLKILFLTAFRVIHDRNAY